jgi:predicted ATP-grasp superfamily ATP-dependent carboligase
MTSTLILVGTSARAAAFSALRAGFRPFAIDRFADRDLAAVCPAVRVGRDPREFLSAMRQAPDAPWMYVGGLENHPRLVDALARLRPLWGVAGRALAHVRDPWELARVAREAGVEVPEVKTSLSANDLAGSGSWLAKPRRSGGGMRVRPATAPGAARRGYYFQREIEGTSCGAVFCASGGTCRLMGATEQLYGGPAPFAYRGSIAAAAVPTSAEQLKNLGQLLADRFDLAGLFNLDFIAADGAIWPLEVNPRYSASVEVLERTTGESFVALHAAAFTRLPAAPLRVESGAARPLPKAAGKWIVYARADGQVPPAFDDWVAAWNGDLAAPGIADLPRVGEVVWRGQPICTILADGPSREAVQRELESRSRAVEGLLARD